MTSDQRIALSAFAAVLVLGGGIFLLASASSGGSGADCSSGEVRGVPIREGQTPDARACEAMDFAIRFFEAPAEECPDFVSQESEIFSECDSKGEVEPSKWMTVADNGVDPAFPKEALVVLENETGFISVDVEQDGDEQKIVDIE